MVIKLPQPRYDSDISIEESMLSRRSIRSFTSEPLTLQEVSQLLWATQGIIDFAGRRAAPSAGALYPLEVYVVAGSVNELSPGVYHYGTDEHQLTKVLDGDVRAGLASAALGQGCVRSGAISCVITAIYERTAVRYGDRGTRYVHIEVGHAAQNLCLQAVALDLRTVVIGAFDDEQVAEVLKLPEDEQPLYIIPVGRE